jgi:hypothetical protein
VASSKKDAVLSSGSKEQCERFKEAARELECDVDEGRFRDRLKKLTEAPAPETVEPKKAAAAKARKKAAKSSG